MNFSDVPFQPEIYNDEVYKWHYDHCREYQYRTFQWYIDTFQPRSVIDFGCGIGSYLEIALANGIKDILGLEFAADIAKNYIPEYLHSFIDQFDCTESFYHHKKFRQFDTVVSFETAEHIRPLGTEQFVANLLHASSNHIIFTAAPPGQLGHGHINMHTKKEWVEFFYKVNSKLPYSLPFVHNVSMQEFISENWKRIGCPSYITDNLIVFSWQHAFDPEMRVDSVLNNFKYKI